MKLMTIGALAALMAFAPAATAYHIYGEDCPAPVGPLVDPVPVVGIDLCTNPLEWSNAFSLTYGPCPPLVPFPGLEIPPNNALDPPFPQGSILTIFPIGCGDILFGLILCEHQGFLEDLIGGIIPGTPPAITGDFSTSGNGGLCNASAGHTDTMVDTGAVGVTDCEFDATVDNGRSNGNWPNYDNVATAAVGSFATAWGQNAANGVDDDCSPVVPAGLPQEGARESIPVDEVSANWVAFTLTGAASAGGQALGVDCLDIAGNLVASTAFYLNEQDLYIRDPHVGLFANSGSSGSYSVAEVSPATVAAGNSCNQQPESFYYL